MKLKDEFVYHKQDDQLVLVDVSGTFSGLVRSNATAGFIIESLRENHSADELVDLLLERFDAPRDVIEKDVEAILAKLSRIGALEE